MSIQTHIFWSETCNQSLCSKYLSLSLSRYIHPCCSVWSFSLSFLPCSFFLLLFCVLLSFLSTYVSFFKSRSLHPSLLFCFVFFFLSFLPRSFFIVLVCILLFFFKKKWAIRGLFFLYFRLFYKIVFFFNSYLLLFIASNLSLSIHPCCSLLSFSLFLPFFIVTFGFFFHSSFLLFLSSKISISW